MCYWSYGYVVCWTTVNKKPIIDLFLPLANPHVRKKIRARILGLQDGPLLILHIDILTPSILKYFVLSFQGEKSVRYFARETENQKA
jgi:hypothetical protein